MRTRDTTRRCFISIELCHLAKNCINTRRIEDEKNAKADNIIKEMRQQWVPKSFENTHPITNEDVSQKLDDSTIST